MKLYKVTDPEFRPYGKVLSGYGIDTLVEALRDRTPLPEGVEYMPEEPALQNLPQAKALAPLLYGGLPVQFGWCNGHNAKLNCLEYHRDSEFNLGTEDFILLLAREDEIVDGRLDTAKVKAFLCPAGVLLEVYGTSLHYAPCHADGTKGFKVMITLPKGTNRDRPAFVSQGQEDKMLWAANKWLLAHPESKEAAQGAYVGLTGENIDLEK